MNKLEDSDLSWQDWFEGEGITVIASEAPPLEIPQPPLPPPVGADWGGAGCLPVMRVMAPEAVRCPSLHGSLSPAPLTATLRAAATWTVAINKADKVAEMN